MVIVPDLRYVIVSIFPQERFKIGLPSIKIWKSFNFDIKMVDNIYIYIYVMVIEEMEAGK